MTRATSRPTPTERGVNSRMPGGFSGWVISTVERPGAYARPPLAHNRGAPTIQGNGDLAPDHHLGRGSGLQHGARRGAARERREPADPALLLVATRHALARV